MATPLRDQFSGNNELSESQFFDISAVKALLNTELSKVKNEYNGRLVNLESDNGQITDQFKKMQEELEKEKTERAEERKQLSDEISTLKDRITEVLGENKTLKHETHVKDTTINEQSSTINEQIYTINEQISKIQSLEKSNNILMGVTKITIAKKSESEARTAKLEKELKDAKDLITTLQNTLGIEQGTSPALLNMTAEKVNDLVVENEKLKKDLQTIYLALNQPRVEEMNAQEASEQIVNLLNDKSELQEIIEKLESMEEEDHNENSIAECIANLIQDHDDLKTLKDAFPEDKRNLPTASLVNRIQVNEHFFNKLLEVLKEQGRLPTQNEKDLKVLPPSRKVTRTIEKTIHFAGKKESKEELTRKEVLAIVHDLAIRSDVSRFFHNIGK